MRIAERGWRALFFVSSALVGESGYLSRGDITAMVRAGMVIGSHSHDHVRLTTMPLAQAAVQLNRSKAILEDITGARVDQLAFPGGTFRPSIVAMARDVGFDLLHGTAWGANRWPPHPGAKPTPVLRRNNVLTGMSASAFVGLVTGRDAVRRAAAYGVKTAARAIVPEQWYGRLRQALSGSSR